LDMIRGGFLDAESRQDLIALARDGSALHSLGRRANALVLLDKGWSCEQVSAALMIDDDTVRTWFKLYQRDGIDGLMELPWMGRSCRLSEEQQQDLTAWANEVSPRSTREIGAWIEANCDVSYAGRSGLIALMRRLGFDYRKPEVVPRKLDVAAQESFIRNYESLLNHLADDETVVFADAVHPTHAARPAGCWVLKETRVAIEQTSGRQRLNIHGALDLETGNTRMIEVATVDANSTIALLSALETLYPKKKIIHVFLDNARYHHAKLVQAWLKRPECRIKLHFLPPYCPHLDPIERLWGLAHKHVTHNKCYATFKEFAAAFLTFLREDVPRKWATFCDTVSDNFRIINPNDFRVLK
jgi:transposase